jgi:hypothetical protein
VKKNLLSISVMEEKGYEVNFQRGQVFIRYPYQSWRKKVMRLTSRGGRCLFAQREPVQILL